MFAAKNAFIGKGSTGYNIARSVRFRGSASAYLNRTFGSVGNQQKFTMSFWFKRSSLGGLALNVSGWSGSGATQGGGFVYFSNDQLLINQQTNNANDWGLQTNQVFRDPSAWYHLVIAVDTTQATAANRVLVYVNGVQVTSFSSATYPTINLNTKFNATNQRIASSDNGGAVYTTFDGYIAEYNFIDGQALTPSSFGAYNIYGVWQPKQYTGTYGTNGFYLKFADNSNAAALGTDSSGNSNTWTVTNINVTAYSGSPPNNTSYDSMTDVPTLTNASVANYPTLNPTAIYSAGNTITASNGNLTFNQATCTANTGMGSSFLAPTGAGLFYYEITQQTKTTVGGDQTQPFVLSVVKTANGTSPSNAFYYWAGGGSTGDPAGATLTGVNGTSIANSDVIMVAIDLAAGKLYLGKNGTWLNSAVPESGTGACATNLLNYATISPAVGNGGGNMTNFTCSLNFGQRPFSYTPPTGFVALNAYNLSTPAISNGASYMAATLYTGNNSTLAVTNTVNGTAMQPDLLWLKTRSGGGTHVLYDSVRGNTKFINSNTTAADTTQGASTGLTSFNSNGFTLAADILVGAGTTNSNGTTFVAWQWYTNGGATVSNTDGSITSTVSANTTAGFAVVTYTGTGAAATVGHGLGAVPSMIIVKKRSGAGTTWAVYNVNIGAANSVSLNSTAASSAQNYWNSTTPTSSVWSMTGNAEVNGSAETYVAYCFAPVAGYSAFGSYTGNGSTDGPFVYLGFKPRWIMLKKTNAIGNWLTIDTSRQNYNVEGPYLNPNALDAETTGTVVFDLLSNGFKCRSTTTANDSGATFIYAAFAENPFKYALAR